MTGEPSRHHRHLIELASILATAGLADAFADVFNMRRDGAGALIGLGLALVAGTVGHHIWLRRTDHAPPAAPAADPPGPPGRAAFPALSAPAVPASASAVAAPATAVARAADPNAGTNAAAADADADAELPTAVWRVRTEIDNTPGRLAVFAGALAAAGANIHALEAHPAPAGVVDEFLVEASPHTTAEQLCAAVRAVGGRAAHAAHADILALMDAPTRVLHLAGRLVRRAASPASVLADLLDADSVSIDEAAINNGPDGVAGEPAESVAEPVLGLDGTTLRLRRPDGSVVTATRPGMPFTVTELGRARAMLELEADLRAGLGAGRLGAGLEENCLEAGREGG